MRCTGLQRAESDFGSLEMPSSTLCTHAMTESATAAPHSAALGQNSQAILAFLAFLLQFAPFQHMEAAHCMYLIEKASLRFYPAGDIITQASDGPASHWFLIRQGLVTGQRINPHNNSHTDELLLSAGDSFPMAALVGDRPTRTTYLATEDTFCLVLDRDAFVQLLKVSEPFRAFALHGVSSLLSELQLQVQAQAHASLGAHFSLTAPVSDLALRNPVTCAPDVSLRQAVQTMHTHQVGSVVIVDHLLTPMGIFTLRDLRRVIADSTLSLNTPVSSLMTPDPIAVSPGASLFDAALIMAEHHIAHVCVASNGLLVGVLSERDLFALQRVDLVHLARAIRQADSLDALQRHRAGLSRLVDAMLAHGADAGQITRMITQLNDHTTSRVIELVLREQGNPGFDFAWLVFGSQARGEQALVTDQDNAIIFQADSDDDASTKRNVLLPLAQAINQALDRCGLTLCRGNIMAGNPDLCLSTTEWRRRFDDIIRSPNPAHILEASIFFDLRPLWGNDCGFEALQQHLLAEVADHPDFQRLLAQAALQYPPAPGTLRTWLAKTMGGPGPELDLKRHGLAPFTDAIRVLALAAGIPQACTHERLKRLAAFNIIKPDDATAWSEACRYLQLVRLQLHQRQASQGAEPSNTLQVDRLNNLQRRMLREALRQVRHAQALLAYRYRL